VAFVFAAFEIFNSVVHIKSKGRLGSKKFIFDHEAFTLSGV
jgi:hypothetical protein